jgi:hypothetical protein
MSPARRCRAAQIQKRKEQFFLMRPVYPYTRTGARRVDHLLFEGDSARLIRCGNADYANLTSFAGI